MTEHVQNALFVYTAAGEIYLEDLVNNEHGTSISPIKIEELRDNSSALLKDTSHIVIAAETAVIKEILQLALKYGFSIGFLPLDGQKALRRCYKIPHDTAEMISLALSDSPSKVDVVFCNDHILLFKGVIGWVPLIDNRVSSSRLKIAIDAIKQLRSLKLLPFKVSTQGKSENSLSTAACGCVILETPEISYKSGTKDDDCSFRDSMVSAVIIAPFSIIDYLKLLWLRVISGTSFSRIRSSVGYIKNNDLIVDPSPRLDVIVDGEKISSTPAHIRVKDDAVKVNHGLTDIRDKRVPGKEKFAVASLPAGKELEKAYNKRLPFFTYASEDRFKDLFTALREDARFDSTYVVLMVLSTMLATVGLYLNSASVIIGAMLLAPLMAPIISLSMSMLRYDRKLFKRSLKKVVIGIAVSLLVAVVLTVISPYQPVTGEMQARLNPSILDLFVAIVAGIAGAYTKSFKEILQSLAGVAIAVALVPPLAVAGIGLGRFDISFFSSSFLLFITNLIGIVLAAIITFRVLGFSPVVRDKRALIIVMFFLIFISIPLSISFRTITERSAFEEGWKHERFLVNDKYLIVNDADVVTYHEHKILVVDIHAREPLNRQDLNAFKKKIRENFIEDVVIRARITYIP